LGSRHTIILLTTILAVTALALAAEAHTNPPPTGDWEISDTTYISKQAITITGGNLSVYAGGSLTLINVTLHFDDTGRENFYVQSGGSLNMEGGHVDSTSGMVMVSLG
jgi:hypothetical protein